MLLLLYARPRVAVARQRVLLNDENIT